MPRATTTTTAAYGEGNDLSFGELLVMALSFPADEIAEDICRATTASVDIGTTPERVQKAIRSKLKQELGVRLQETSQVA